ncbi:MAG: serine/threonine-protein phosphatase [Rhodopirellula sp.]|nr:serine/threonine-protein phosphatase [Rhodopirellula sp.]
MDVRLLLDKEMTEGELHPIAHGTAALYSARSPDKQTANEDAAALVLFDDVAGVLAVADGLGGERAGEQASRTALAELIASIRQADHNEASLRTAILNGFENANRAVAALGLGAGTTLAVAEIQGRTVRSYHVGDSMMLVVGQRGKIKLQTISHSPVGYAVESGLLDAAEAMHHEDRHVISNMVGSADMRIEMGSTVELAPRDTLILASDGLFDNLRIPEIVDRIRKGSLRRAIAELAEACGRRMHGVEPDEPSKPDDLTFIIYRLTAPKRATEIVATRTPLEVAP